MIVRREDGTIRWQPDPGDGTVNVHSNRRWNAEERLVSAQRAARKAADSWHRYEGCLRRAHEADAAGESGGARLMRQRADEMRSDWWDAALEMVQASAEALAWTNGQQPVAVDDPRARLTEPERERVAMIHSEGFR